MVFLSLNSYAQEFLIFGRREHNIVNWVTISSEEPMFASKKEGDMEAAEIRIIWIELSTELQIQFSKGLAWKNEYCSYTPPRESI